MLRLLQMVVPDAVTRIAPFPQTALAIIERLPNHADEPYQITDLVAREPEWQREVPYVVYRPDEGININAIDPEEVIAALPVDELAKIVVTIASHQYIRNTMTRTELQRYWRYTLACATASDELARNSTVNRALAYSAGLLHDAGRLALMASYPEKYANLLTLTERMFRVGEQFDLSDYERTLFGLDRFAIAEWLADAWQLPESLRSIVVKFQNVPPGQELDLVTTVRFGTRLAHALGFGLMLGAPRARPREILGQLPGPVRRRWLDFQELPHVIEGRLVRYAELWPVRK